MRDQQYDITHEGDMGSGRESAMSLDLASLPHLSKVLSGFYEDKVGAIIREYPSNARDSHIEAGKADVPIEIVLPRPVNPEFIVRDFGVGMSEDEVHEVFNLYGKSTKRDSDDVVGMYGLGCKSALTYTKQFTLIAVKDGVKCVCNVFTGKDGAGRVKTIEKVKTDESNGVEISIPVNSDFEEFVKKCRLFFQFWEPGTVLINNEAPESIFDNEEVVELDPDVFLVPSRMLTMKDESDVNYWRYTSHDYVVMGGVPYAIKDPLIRIRPATVKVDWRVVARVPIGAVTLTPQRESLEDDKRNKRLLKEIETFVQDRVSLMAQNELDAALDPSSAIEVRTRWSRVLTSFKAKWQGMNVPTTFIIMEHGTSFVFRAKTRHSPFVMSNPTSIDLDNPDETLIVVGHTNKAVPARNQERIRKYLEENNLDDVNEVYILQSHPRSVWLEKIPVVHWDEIAAIELPKRSNGGSRSASSSDGPVMYRKWKFGSGRNAREVRTVKVEKPECTRPVFVSTSEGINNYYSIANLFTEASSELFLISTTSYDKFKREFNGIHARDFVDWRIRDFFRRLTDMQRYAISVGGFFGTAWAMLNEDRVEDPDLKEFLESRSDGSRDIVDRYRSCKDAFKSIIQPVKNVPEWGHLTFEFQEIKRSKAGQDAFEELMKRYPLIQYMDTTYGRGIRLRDELHRYVNLVWSDVQALAEDEAA